MLKVGDSVAWTHKYGAVFGTGTVLKREAILALDPASVIGTVVAVENELGTHLRVTFGDAERARVAALAIPAREFHILTHEELVQVEG